MQQKNPPSVFKQLKNSSQPLFEQLSCASCQKIGTNTLFLVNIPFFTQIVVTSFSCDLCTYKSQGLLFDQQSLHQGVKITFNVKNQKDLQRELIKSKYARVTIKELEFQIPSNQKSEITDISSLFDRCILQISQQQPKRKQIDQHLFGKVSQFITSIKQLKTVEKTPFTLVIDDPTGLSFIKDYSHPQLDPQIKLEYYARQPKQFFQTESKNYQGSGIKNEDVNKQALTAHKIDMTKPLTDQDLKKEALVFQVECHSCGLMGQTKMCETNIPYFKDLMIMSFKCDHCGAHSTETKTSKSIGQYGLKIVLKHPNNFDLKRDLFKSDTCSVEIPQLELELDYGTLGGVYTTVEGLIEKIHDHLNDNNPFTDPDEQFGKRMAQLLRELNECRSGCRAFTLILVDPVSHSFLQNPHHPNEDVNVVIQQFIRSQDQNEFLGILDMKVQNYN